MASAVSSGAHAGNGGTARGGRGRTDAVEHPFDAQRLVGVRDPLNEGARPVAVAEPAERAAHHRRLPRPFVSHLSPRAHRTREGAVHEREHALAHQVAVADELHPRAPRRGDRLWEGIGGGERVESGGGNS